MNDEVFYYNNPGAFYWAGFIAADGCIQKIGNNHRIRINLCRKDKDHLVSFMRFLESDKKLYDYKRFDNRYNKTYYGTEAQVCSKKMCADLERFGIREHKSVSYGIPAWVLRNKHSNHFVRGYIDGDGGWHITQKKDHLTLRLGIRGTEECLTSIVRLFGDRCNTRYTKKVSFDGGTYRVGYDGNIQCAKIRDFLYSRSDELFLQRKKDIAFKNELFTQNKYGRKAVIGTNALTGKEIYLSHASVTGTDFNATSICACCNGRQKVHRGYAWRYAENDIICLKQSVSPGD